MNDSQWCESPIGSKSKWHIDISPEWADRFEATSQWQRKPGLWVREGTCPDCQHSVKFEITDVIGAERLEELEVRLCNCGCTHESWDGSLPKGCGSGGRIPNPENASSPGNEGEN